MKKHVRKNVGTCSTETHVTLKDGIVQKVRILNGCVGNTQGLCRLMEGRPAAEVVELLAGIRCQNGTSCPDQAAKAIREAMEKAGE